MLYYSIIIFGGESAHLAVRMRSLYKRKGVSRKVTRGSVDSIRVQTITESSLQKWTRESIKD